MQGPAMWIIKTCAACHASVPREQWPFTPKGTAYKHCGCKTKDPSIMALPAHMRPSTRDKRNKYKSQIRLNSQTKPFKHGKHAICDAHVKCWLQLKAKAASKAIKSIGALHDAHVKLWRRVCSAANFRHRYKTDATFNATQKLRAKLRKHKTLDGGLASSISVDIKAGRLAGKWQSILGYNMNDLVSHLKRTVPKGSRWEQFLTAELHIDHITPRSAFDLTITDNVKACWCLSNLRLIPAKENMRKSAKIEYLL